MRQTLVEFGASQSWLGGRFKAWKAWKAERLAQVYGCLAHQFDFFYYPSVGSLLRSWL